MIKKHLSLKPRSFSLYSDYSTPVEEIRFFSSQNGIVTLPYSYGRKMAQLVKYPISLVRSEKSFGFTGELLPRQIEVVAETFQQLADFYTTTLNLYTGFGKTVVAAYLACKLKLKVLVVFHRDIFFKQWSDTFKKFTNVKQFSYLGIEPEEWSTYDVILCMDTRVQALPEEIRENVGTFIIDEAHCFCTPTRARVLLSVNPKYIICCTATLKRNDKMESMIQTMCGYHSVTRTMDKKFTVYKLNTGIDIAISLNVRGKPDWDKITKKLINHDERNTLIIDIIKRNPSHKILVLAWRHSHIKILEAMLKAEEENYDTMYGKKKTYQDSRILLGTISKIGTGFDEQTACDTFAGFRINLLIFVGSMKSVSLIEQTSGRVMRSDQPNIIQLVDNFAISKKHWRIAERWYRQRNCEIVMVNVPKSEKK